jgi:hypothetical protein
MVKQVRQAGILILVGGMAWGVQAGTVIQQQENLPGQEEARQRVSLYVDSGKVRVEGENPASGKYLVIFDQATQIAWMVDLAKGTYMEFTAEQVQGTANQMREAMQQMDEQMANLPPAQRAMMEQMMQGRMGVGNAAQPAVSVRQKASGETVGQFSCTRYEVLRGEQKTQEVCAASADQIQLDPSVVETFKAMAAFYEPLMRQLPRGNWAAPSGMSQIPGFPVQTVRYEGEEPSSEWRVVKIEDRALDAALFTLPPDLKKTEMPTMPSM